MTLELDGVRKSYGDFELGPVDLTVGDEVLSVLGPSGCGKTTLLWLVAGILRPEAGSITLDGRPFDHLPPEERNAGIVFQDGALFPNMTVRENVEYASADSERTADLVGLLEIDDVLDRRPQTLSGGERQRVALARTLATDPDVLLLDEPLSSLDAPIRRRLREELHDLFRSLSIPVVVVTHDQRTATALGDRLAVLNDGEVRQVGSPSEILARPRSRFVADFTGNENLFEVEVLERENGAVGLRVGDVILRAEADPLGHPVATACVHPSRIRLRSSETAPSGENSMRGTVRRWLNEGDEYRVRVALDGAPITLTATVPPPTFEGLSVDSGSAVRVHIAPDAIHLLTNGGEN